MIVLVPRREAAKKHDDCWKGSCAGRRASSGAMQMRMDSGA